MSVKTQRKIKAQPGSSKAGAAKKVRGSAPKTTLKSNGKYPLTAYEHLHIGIVEASLDGKYVDANEEFCRILGYSKKELLRFGVKDCTHEDDYALDIKLHEQLVDGKIPFYGLEKRYVQKDGGIIWVELTRSLVRDEDGKPVCTIGAVLDISDRKQVERALRESAESLRLATEAARMFKWELDFQKQVYTFADNFEQVLGFSAGLLPQNDVEAVWRLSPAEDVQSISKAIAKAIENRSDLHSLQYRMVNPEDGRVVWLEANAKVVYDEAGNAQRMFGVAQNITESKKAREEIQIASRMPAENPNPVMRLTPDGKILYANDASAPLLAAWTQQVEQRIPDELQGAITNAFTAGVKMEVEVEDRGIFFSCTLAPIPEAGYVNLYGKDVSAHKRADEALRAKEQELQEIINRTPFMLTRCSRDLHYRFVSQAYARMIGRTPEEVAGKSILEIMGEKGLKTISPYIERVLQGEQVEYETEVPFQGVGAPSLHVVYTPDRAEQGNVIGWFASMVDITERKRAEQALAEFARQQEALYRLSDQLHHTNSLEDVYNAALSAILRGLQCDRASILLFDDAGVMRFVAWHGLSDGYRNATEGHSPWSADEKNPYPVCVSDIRTSDLSDSLKAAIQKEGIGSLVFIPLLLNGKLIGKFMAYFNVPHDCSDVEIELGLMIARQLASGIDQKRAEEQLRASETLYRTIARSIPGGGVYVVDKDFRYLVAEGSVTGAFGLTREMLEGHRVSEIFSDDRGARMENRLRRNFAGETVSFETEHNGRVYWTQQAPLLDSIGQAIILTIDITERKRTEESLRQSEERFVQFMQHLPGLAWIKDAQGRYMFANAAAEKAFNTPRAKLYGKTDTEIFPPETAARFKQNDERALESEKGMQTVETLQQEDGILHYSLVTKFPIPGPDGNTALIGGTAFDITERLQAEEALRESEERFRAMVSQATAGIIRQDAEGSLIFVNQAFCNMLGYTELELLGKTTWEFTYADDIEENKHLYERMMTEGIPFKIEKRLIRADGSVIWVDVSVDPVMDAAGNPQSAVAVEVDITGRKQAEADLQQLNLQLESRVQKRTATIQAINQSLRDEIAERERVEEALRQSEATARASEEKLHTLFDLLPIGITFLDPEGKILQINSAVLDILKLSKEQLFSHAYKPRKYIRADGTPMPLSEFASARALRENKTIYNVETGIALENEVIWTSISAAPVDVAEVGVVVVTVDITDTKRAEQALKESHRRLQILSQRLVEVQEEERRALARELHDRVGQTLAALNINLIIIDGQLSPDTSQQIGARLDDSMKLVAETIALVRDVMTDLRPAVLDDYGLEAALESQLTKFTSRYNIKVVFEKPDRPIPRLGPSVEMTLLRIAQEALMNIARHSRARLINLSLRHEEDGICLSVQDDGIGIESWQDANRPGSHGLTIMRERADAFGGKLRVSSVPGEGTTVEVTIPFKNNNQEKVEEQNL